jgi:hypothetical protein
MPLKPPPHPQPVKAGLERFGVYGTRWGAMAVIALVALWGVNEGTPAPQLPVDGVLPVQQWTVDVSPRAIAFALPGALPKPTSTQKRPPCAAKIGEEEVQGYCWLRLDVSPPCPQEADAYAWEYGGKCFQRVLRAERTPTTGEIRPGNVAGEAQ